MKKIFYYLYIYYYGVAISEYGTLAFEEVLLIEILEIYSSLNK